jgi:hypothetical protein
MGSEKLYFPHKFVTKKKLNYVGPVPSCKYFESLESHKKFCEKHSYFDLKLVSIEYCMRDVKIVYDMMNVIKNIVDVYDKNILKKSFSFSSLSYKIFSKKFDHFKITKIRNNNFTHNYIKNGYYGGRCEVFGNPSEDSIIHYFDFTGMYAQCMLEKFPKGEPILLKENLDYKKIGFHTVKVKVDDYLPFLPYRGEKLFFPSGIFLGTF